MKHCFLIGVLLLASAVFAQFTTVTGTVTDPNGLPYANGTIAPTLVTSSTPKFTATGQLYLPPSQASGLDLTGSFSVTLADNTTLTPGGTTWSFTVCSAGGTVQPSFGKGPQCFSVVGVTISGASQSITATLSAAAPSLTVAFGVGGTITGSGTSGTIPIWTGTNSLGNSPLTFAANRVTFGNTAGVSIAGPLSIGTGGSGGTIGTYNGLSAVGNKMTLSIGIQSGSSFLGNVPPTSIFAVPSTASSTMYRVSCYLVVTATATSSTLPQCQVSWTDSSTSTVETVTFSSTNAANTVGAIGQGSMVILPANSSTVNISTTGYASTGGSMAYTSNFQLEKF